MKYCGTGIFLLYILVCSPGFFAQSETPASRGPRVLSDSEAQPYYVAFNKYPEEIRKAFGLGLDDENLPSYFKCQGIDKSPYPQTIKKPNGETLMIISGDTRVGLIVFDKKPRIVRVISWSDYLYTEIVEPIYAFEKVKFRFVPYKNTWELIAEVHAITGMKREPKTHYLWEFSYAGWARGSSDRYPMCSWGSSFKYCMKDTGWSPLPEPIRQGTSTEVLRDKAVMLLERGEYQKASIDFEQVIKKERGNLYYISNGNEWLATGRIEKVLFNLGKCYENIAENETGQKLKREFEWKALRAYEQQIHRQSILRHLHNINGRIRLDDYIEFKDYLKHHASVFLLALKVCGYNEFVLQLELPNLYREFSPFAFTFLDREKGELRIAFISPRAACYPQRCLAVGTFKEGKLTWLEYRGREVLNIPSKIGFIDIDGDGRDEVVLTRTIMMKKWDKFGMVVESREVVVNTVLKVLDDKVILLKEEQLPWNTF